jgi:hypothetical protein
MREATKGKLEIRYFKKKIEVLPLTFILILITATVASKQNSKMKCHQTVFIASVNRA